MTIPKPIDPRLDRLQLTEDLQKELFDIIVIGGGITGAGIARDAAMRGYSVALVDKNDFAAGTSSKSSKLIHGGFRYLKQYELGLVNEACMERYRLLKLAPHLVRPLSFVYPIYEDHDEGPFLVRVGMWAYDMLALFRNTETHEMLDRSEVVNSIPSLQTEELEGGASYYDCQVDDARLVVTTIRSARAAGAKVMNYAEVVDLTKSAGDRINGVRVKDLMLDTDFRIRSRLVVNAAGPWVDSVRWLDDADAPERLKPSKGVHIVVPKSKLPVDHAAVVRSDRDKRMLFAIPWQADTTMIGTTDTIFDDSPDKVVATAEDVQYLLSAVHHNFPAVRLEPDDIVSTWAGLRPLISSDAPTASDISREHEIFRSPSGLLSIAGGKLTTYRSMAAELVDDAEAILRDEFDRPPMKRSQTHKIPLLGGHVRQLNEYVRQTFQRASDLDIPRSDIRHLVFRYGDEAADVIKLIEQDPELREPLVGGLPFLQAELVFAVRSEMARTLTDVLSRRTRILDLDPHHALDHIDEISRLMAEECGWDAADRDEDLAQYHEAVADSEAFRQGIT